MSKEELMLKLEQTQNDLAAANSRNSELARRITKAITYINECDWNEWDNGADINIINILEGELDNEKDM